MDKVGKEFKIKKALESLIVLDLEGKRGKEFD